MTGPLNHSPADIVRNLLVDLGLGVLPTTVGTGTDTLWQISEDYERDYPDNMITVYDTSGVVDGRHHDDGETQLHHGVQIRVRGPTKPIAWAKAHAVQQNLDDVQRTYVTIGSDQYLVQAIHMTSDIIRVGEESSASRRRIYTINALITVRMTS